MTEPPPTAQPRRSGRRPLWLAGAAALVTLLSIVGLYSRQAREATVDQSASAPNGLFLASQAEGTTLASVGRAAGLPAPCTAWLLDTGGSAADPAFAVTAAPCVGVTGSAAVRWDEPVEGATLVLHAFAPMTSTVEPDLVTVRITEVAWASARWTNLAVVGLGATVGQLVDRGIRPIRVAAVPAPGTKVLVAGVPVDGVAQDQRYLRGATCTVADSTDLLEGPWVWRDVLGSDCGGTLGGSAGSPALDVAGDAVAMVVSTTIAMPEAPDCARGRPCEVRAGAVQPPRADTTYLVGVAGLAGCFRDGALSLGTGCPLEDPTGVAPAAALTPVAAPGSTVAVRLDPRLAAPRVVADRVGPLATLDCTRPAGWSRPVPARRWALDVTLPEQEGWTLACVGSAQQPTPVVLRAAASTSGAPVGQEPSR